MMKVWLLGLAAAAILVVGPMLAAYAADEGTPPPKHERKTEGGKGEGKQLPPPIAVDAAKTPELAAAVTAAEDAIAKLQAQAVKDIGEKDARRLVMQVVSKAVRGTKPEAAKGEGRKERKSERKVREGTDHVPGGTPGVEK